MICPRSHSKAVTFDSPSNVLHARPFSFFPLGRNNPFIFIKVQLQAAKFLGAKLHSAISHHSIGTLSIYTEEISYWATRLLIKIEKKRDLKMALWDVWVCAAKNSHYPSQTSGSIKTRKFQISNSNDRKCFENILKVIKQKP